MKRRKLVALVVLLGSLTPVRAQMPAIPGMPAVPGAAGAAGAEAAAAGAAPAAAPAAAPPRTLWNFLGITPQNCAKCQARWCPSGAATMARSMLTPMRMMTGGLAPPCCPPYPSAADIASQLASGAMSPAEAAAAKIKADEAASKARRAAVRYLGTVDCHYYPEAEAGIISALRSDRIECVRMEAALALLNGCCCTKKTVEALSLVVSGSDKDGNPAETSERVKCLAYQALARCMSHPLEFGLGSSTIVAPEPPELPVPGIVPEPGVVPGIVAPPPAAVTPVAYRPVVPRLEDPAFVEAHRLHAERIATPSPTKFATGNRSLFNVLVQARTPIEPRSPAAAGTAAAVVETPVANVNRPAPLAPIGALPQ